MMLKATDGHPREHERVLRRLEHIKSGEPVNMAAWQVSEHLPLLLYQWRELYGERVLVHGDGRIEPEPDPQ